MKLKKIFCTLLLATGLHGTYAQNVPALPGVQNHHDFYRNGLGLRLGWPIASVMYKHFFATRKALEFIASPRFGGGSLTVLAEKHVPARRPDIYWYYGGGINAGIFKGAVYKNYEGNFYDDNTVTSIGLNIVLGLEMNIRNTPLSLSFDFIPRIGIYNPGGSMAEGGVSLKYTWPW